MTDASFSIRHCHWDTEQSQLRAIREAVFIIEQHVPIELEWDELDALSDHLLVVDRDGTAIATARLTPDAHIGRMAVLRPWRRQGIGSSMLLTLCRLAQQRGASEVALNAQTYAIPFYEKHGFSAHGDEFDDAGIPHRSMSKSLR